jgi:SIR2-like domain
MLPLKRIASLLAEGRIVPFLGAGVSLRPADVPAATPGLPSGGELSRRLAADSNYPSDDEHDLLDLAKVASYYVDVALDRDDLRDALRRVFTGAATPNAIHRYLASIDAPLLIVTTNYDDLMEQALREAGREFDLVVHPTDRKDYEAAVFWWPHGADEPVAIEPNKLYIDLSKRAVVYKMHGTIIRQSERWDSFVITEDDYVDFLARMTGQTAVPQQFLFHFRRARFLFLGYGLRDWNLRVLLRTLHGSQGALGSAGRLADAAPVEGDDDDEPSSRRRAWAIQYRPSEVERALWQARKVSIYDLELDRFVEMLRAERAG